MRGGEGGSEGVGEVKREGHINSALAQTMSADSATLNTRLVSRKRRFSVGMYPSRNMLIPVGRDGSR